MFAVTAAELTTEGIANILANRYIPLWGCPSTLLSDNGPQFCAQLATAVYKLLSIHKLTASAYHLAETAALNVLTTPWHRCLPWSVTNIRTTGMST